MENEIIKDQHDQQNNIPAIKAADNYSKFIDGYIASEKKDFQNSIDNLLITLNSLISLADSIRIDDNIALHSTINSIHTKCQKFDKHFESIDKLETLVKKMKENVDEAEMSVNRAEKELRHNPISNAIQHIPFLSNIKKTKTPVLHNFIPFNIIDTKKYFSEHNLFYEKKDDLIEHHALSGSVSLPDVVANTNNMSTKTIEKN